MPTIFLSAATIDLEPWRDVLHGAFSRAGFRVLTQKHSLGAATGDVRRLLTAHIEESDCVIHLAGMGYGWDAQDPFPEAPEFVCSWTQFEYYYSHFLSKDVIAFVCAPNLSKVGFQEEGDDAERARKALLQLAHRDRVMTGQFDGTPLATKVPRKSNEAVESVEKLVQAVAAAIGTLQKLGPERLQVQHDLSAIAPALARIEHDVDQLNEKVAGILRILDESHRFPKDQSTPDPNTAVLKFRAPHAWSYWRIGGTQTIKWDVFAPQHVSLQRFELELYLEHSRQLTICDDAALLSGSVRKYRWQIPVDLQEEAYRLHLVGWDFSGHRSEAFSPPFRLRKLDVGENGWGPFLAMSVFYSFAIGLGIGARRVAPWFFESVKPSKQYFNDDFVGRLPHLLVQLAGERFWTVAIALAMAELGISVVIIATRMCILCVPARLIFAVLAAAGAGGGYLLDPEMGVTWGGLLAVGLGIPLMDFFRQEDDIEWVLEQNVRFWKFIGRKLLAAWNWGKQRLAK